ncbi:glycosyltransferase [Sphingomonas oryzagri]
MAPSSSAPAARIAIVFQDFAVGGTERIMVRLANAWARDREVAIFCGDASGPARAGLSNRVALIEATPATPRSLLSRWRLGRRLATPLRTWQADVIVGPGNHVLPIFLAIGKAPAPLVCKLSNPIDPAAHSAWPSTLLAPWRRRACAPLSGIVAMSPALRDEAAAYLRTDRVDVVAEPIFAAKPLGHPRSRRPRARIVFAGRLVAQKNVALALRTLAELPDDMTLTIVGDGPERPRLEALARRLRLRGRVIFTGHVPDIAPYLADGDLFLLPSRFEGYPAVLIEALAAGLPVVTTSCSPAMREIVAHPSFGRIVAAEPVALAAAILSLGNSENPDPTAIDALIDRHGLAASADAWLQCLDDVVERSK